MKIESANHRNIKPSKKALEERSRSDNFRSSPAFHGSSKSKAIHAKMSSDKQGQANIRQTIANAREREMNKK